MTVCFNSRTPGGVRLASSYLVHRSPRVSIHAPREGCDLRGIRPSEMRREFQFTHPGRGATMMSVHIFPDTSCFNSRTPGGVRRLRGCLLPYTSMFQFTHPGRGATDRSLKQLVVALVSIHAPREGCDVIQVAVCNSCDVSIHAPREGCDYVVTTSFP